MARARALEGCALVEIAIALGVPVSDDAVRTKGKGGELLERALGATGGSQAVHDFPELGVELKSIPVDPNGKVLESTYVCRFELDDAETAEWDSSWARAKLACVLWVPVVAERKAPWSSRVVGRAVLWTPSDDEAATLRSDFDDVVGLVGKGDVDALDGRTGDALHVRPKAPNGQRTKRVRTPDGHVIATVPRGFYLRPSFTQRIVG